MSNILLPQYSDRPYIYSSFVSTIDGKIFVDKPGYWPIGSSEDYKRFTQLRAQSDIILDGKNTALVFGDKTIDTIHGETFKNFREKAGISKAVQYGILTNHPDTELVQKLENTHEYKPIILTSDHSFNSPSVTIERFEFLDPEVVMQTLFEKGFSRIFIDGGPKLIASLLQKNLLDEIFLTIAPKIFGSEEHITMTMVEGILFQAESIHPWKIVNVDREGDELFIRYARK